ncbi:helix-turn-helix domain-containing protein [candidate division WOR-3 bacterium]|nr:helix-turn-helix domain-containing protein [candidate division WOR-3 bacterium]
MPQIQLPLFPPELTEINRIISFQKRNGRVYYFHYLSPIYSHEEGDIESFRYITSQLIINGNVSQIEIAHAFGVSYISVKRGVKRLREKGTSGFFKKRKGRTSHILTEEIIEKAQNLLNKGDSPGEIAKVLKLKANTIRKAIQAGRLKKKSKN